MRQVYENFHFFLCFIYLVSGCFNPDQNKKKPAELNDLPKKHLAPENKPTIDDSAKNPTTPIAQTTSNLPENTVPDDPPLQNQPPQEQLPVESFASCNDVVTKAYAQLPQPTIDKESFEKKYSDVKKLTGGASGDTLYSVTDESGKQRILKIFEEPGDDNKFEIMITCRNSKIPFFPLFDQMNQDNAQAFGTFFPKYYEMGTRCHKREIDMKYNRIKA